MASLYDQYKTKMSKISDLGHAAAVLHWDKETYLPPKGAQHRSQQLATLSGVIHNEFTSKSFGGLLVRLTKMKTLDVKQKRNVTLTHKDYVKATRFTEEFVRRKSMAVSHCYHAWVKAKEANDYKIYIEPLQALIDIIREEVEIIGYTGHPYDVCIDNYEPGMTVAVLDPFFLEVKKKLKPIIDKVNEAKPIKNKFLRKHFPKNKQWEFGIEVLKNMGYDMEAGRQDISPHPFTTSFSPQDVRVTTRIDENDFLNMTWSCIHEGGHALYEQGLPMEEYGLYTGSAISLGIHESQSRLWENNVGRSKEYWSFLYPILQKRFKKQLKGISLNKFYKSINAVKPNLIRTEADELHYHYHVLIRYEIEKGILEGKYNAKDLKREWNKRYEKYLGISAENDSEGVLQDVHWAHGSIGYFPTYSLGSFYAAQFYAAAENEIPKLSKQLSQGKTGKLLKWLRKNIHCHGRMYEADVLCEKVTGEKLNTKYFMEYAEKKYADVYGF